MAFTNFVYIKLYRGTSHDVCFKVHKAGVPTKHRLGVHVRAVSALAEAVLTSAHNLCFEEKIMEIGIPPAYPSFAI